MKIFAFGSNGSGQLAIGHTEDVSLPTECLFSTPPADNDEIIQIAAGGNHTLLLTKKGHVFAAGCNTDGRCGPPLDSNTLEENLLSFRRVVLPDPNGSLVETFKHVSATWEGSILVASVPTATSESSQNCDKVFVLGSTPKGELGIGTSAQPPRPGTSIPEFPPCGTTVTALASGMGHTVATLSNGHVYGWGGSRKNQLGRTLQDQKIVWKPSRIEDIPFETSGTVCGREFTVLLGDRSRGEFVVLGDPGNRWGFLIYPLLYNLYVLVRRPGAPALNTDPPSGKLLAWGRNDRGQLPPASLPSVVKVAVGSEHVLALLPDRSVATFGWGEHGNCGTDTDSRGNVAGSHNAILLPDAARDAGGKVVGVGAGCATSWFL
ncbi:hypothetical protein N7512_000824, partial [Penicillium capsulatum]